MRSERTRNAPEIATDRITSADIEGVPVETTDFRAIQDARNSGELSNAAADELHSARLAYVVKKVEDGIKMAQWNLNRSFGL